MSTWKKGLMFLGFSLLALAAFGNGEATQDPDVQVLMDHSWAELSSKAPAPSEFDLLGFGSGGGSCYTGCFSAQISAVYCSGGKVAEVTVSGPINACKVSSIRCVSTCDGWVVSCNGFTQCGP